jgi:hypothetical protein
MAQIMRITYGCWKLDHGAVLLKATQGDMVTRNVFASSPRQFRRSFVMLSRTPETPEVIMPEPVNDTARNLRTPSGQKTETGVDNNNVPMLCKCRYNTRTCREYLRVAESSLSIESAMSRSSSMWTSAMGNCLSRLIRESRWTHIVQKNPGGLQLPISWFWRVPIVRTLIVSLVSKFLDVVAGKVKDLLSHIGEFGLGKFAPETTGINVRSDCSSGVGGAPPGSGIWAR